MAPRTRSLGILTRSFANGGAILVLSAALGLTTAAAQAPSEAEKLEKCYGISIAGQNDGKASGPDADIPATSNVDYDGQAWRFVENGTCTKIETPYGPGSLQPIPGRP